MLTMTVKVNKYGLVSIRVCCKWERGRSRRRRGREREERNEAKKKSEWNVMTDLHCVLLFVRSVWLSKHLSPRVITSHRSIQLEAEEGQWSVGQIESDGPERKEMPYTWSIDHMTIT